MILLMQAEITTELSKMVLGMVGGGVLVILILRELPKVMDSMRGSNGHAAGMAAPAGTAGARPVNEWEDFMRTNALEASRLATAEVVERIVMPVLNRQTEILDKLEQAASSIAVSTAALVKYQDVELAAKELELRQLRAFAARAGG